MWVRIDPEVTWLRHVTFEQPDYMWQYQLRHERDVIAQCEVQEFSEPLLIVSVLGGIKTNMRSTVLSSSALLYAYSIERYPLTAKD